MNFQPINRSSTLLCKRAPEHLSMEKALLPSGLYEVAGGVHIDFLNSTYEWTLFSDGFDIEDLEKHIKSILMLDPKKDTAEAVVNSPIYSFHLEPGSIILVTDEWVCSDTYPELPTHTYRTNIWQKAIYEGKLIWTRACYDYVRGGHGSYSWVRDEEQSSPLSLIASC